MDSIQSYLNYPFPIWGNKLTNQLVTHEWHRLINAGLIQNEEHYNSADVYLSRKSDTKTVRFNNLPDAFDIKLEITGKEFTVFLSEHGLEVVPPEQVRQESNYRSLIGGLQLISAIPECQSDINGLIATIVLLKQEYPEYDTSYSHPQIPFTVFVSSSSDMSVQSSLRCAESIIHEAMHLKLSLIEKHVQLVSTNPQNLYYSPWREEMRPAQGVMHGIFVFRAVQEFYKVILPTLDKADKEFCEFRIEQISNELRQVNTFVNATDLTPSGATLVKGLLPSN